MLFDKMVTESKKRLPYIKIKYKDESPFMRLLGYLLFFNKSFMEEFTTTIGYTIYFPSRKCVEKKPISSSIVLMHELTHILDAVRFGKYWFGFLYLFPQILALLALPILFFNPLLAGLFAILCLLPWPAWFRMNYERRAYMVSLHVLHKLSKKIGFKALLSVQSNRFLKHFSGFSYYLMWVFSDIKDDFACAVALIKTNARPFEDSMFDVIDDIIDASLNE